MIRGFFDNSGHPCIILTVTGGRRQMEIQALLDTGFDGELVLPVDVAVQLGLELVAREDIELADGSIQSSLTFSGVVTLDRGPQAATMGLTESDDPLIGAGLLAGRRMTMDFAKRTIRIT